MKHKFLRTACLGLASLLLVAPLALSGKTFNHNGHNTTLVSSQNLQLNTLEDLNKANPADVAKLPKYDSRDYNLVTSVKTQHKPKCYTFAAGAALETAILKNPALSQYTNTNLDISEENIDWISKKRTASNDPLGLTSQDTMDRPLWDGGYIFNTTNTLPQWNGPIAQSSPMETYRDPLAIVKNAFYMKHYSPYGETAQDTINKLKEAVAQYGAIAFSFQVRGTLNTKYYNANNTGGIAGAHACAIVGWDDTIKKESYSPAAEYDGGWIVKNSWGTGTNDKGYFYMSYDSMMSELCGYEMTTKDAYQNNYYYDGKTDSPYANNPTIYGSKPLGVIFPTLKASTTVKEKLSAVNVGINGDNVTATIEVYTGVDADLNDRTSAKNNPRSGTLRKTIQKNFKYAGIYTVDLDEPIELQPGENFSVVVTVSNPTSDAAVMLSKETSTNDLTYCLSGDKWNSTYKNIFGGEDEGNLVPRIKAFTTSEDIVPDINTDVTVSSQPATTQTVSADNANGLDLAVNATSAQGKQLIYQWYKATDATATNWAAIPSATSSTYNIPSSELSKVTTETTWKYKLEVKYKDRPTSVRTLGNYSVIVKPVAVKNTISFTTNLAATANLTAGTSTTFTVQAKTNLSNATLTYDWYLDKGDGSGVQRVQSSTDNTYTIKDTDTSDLTETATWRLYVKAYPSTDSSLVATSTTCVISIAPKVVEPEKPVEPTPDPTEEIKKDITINNQPNTSQDVPSNKDGGLNLEIDATSTKGKQLKYQWYEDKGSGWQQIAGATNKIYNVPSSELKAVTTAATWKYKAEIQYQDGSSTGTYTSQTYQVNVKPTSTTPTPDNSTTKYSKFLSTPAIIGIAAGAVGVAALVGSAVYFVKRHKKHLK